VDCPRPDSNDVVRLQFATAKRTADSLPFANNSVYEENVAARAIAHIKQLIEEGVISKARIDAFYRRIKRLKESLL
jgi:hypothetical protein